MKRAVVVLLVTSFCWMSALGQDMKKCKKVAEMKQVGKNKVMVCDRSLLKDTIVLPLSYFTEELQMVKLESKDEALVYESDAIIGDNYILVKGQDQNPFKLFDKSGKFITNIGAFGKGPNEYQNVYDQQLDEKNNRAYLLPWQSDKILVYDLKGNNLDPIRLPSRAPKGTFRVNPDNLLVSVITFPLTQGPFTAPYFAWTQKMTGEVVNGVAPGSLSLDPRNVFNNEVMSSDNTKALDLLIFTFDPRNDTLYHYDTNANKLIPQFTLDFKSRPLNIHSYLELPQHYIGDLSDPKQISANTTITQNQVNYIVEKSTQKGAFIQLNNDFLGGGGEWPSFSNGYYVKNIEPGNLLELLEKALSSNKKLSSAMRQKLAKIKDDIKETDNNYIFYAKLK